jgi:hypothetical protein
MQRSERSSVLTLYARFSSCLTCAEYSSSGQPLWQQRCWADPWYENRLQLWQANDARWRHAKPSGSATQCWSNLKPSLPTPCSTVQSPMSICYCYWPWSLQLTIAVVCAGENRPPLVYDHSSANKLKCSDVLCVWDNTVIFCGVLCGYNRA